VNVPYSDIYDLSELIVFSDPLTGQIIRLRDVARLERRYQEASQYIQYSDSLVNGNQCLIFSMEMRPGHNVVAFGDEVNKEIETFLATAPPDIKVHRITDQPVVVNKSVRSFLKDLIEAVIIVILVMLFLFPLRTALVSSTSVPVCIAAAWAIMNLLGIELNTVTLAALIVVLGMIVDDSVVVIDGYTDMLNSGRSRWYSAAVSTKSLMTSMLIATCSISFMFFPMLSLMKGTNMGDFIGMFPWAIFITLSCSFLYAIWVIPYLSARIIGPSNPNKRSKLEKIQAKFFDALQKSYKKLLDLCFRHKWGTIIVSVISVAIGVFFLTRINIQMLPKAEREFFAVEIHLNDGATPAESAAVADSLAAILRQDARVESVTAFIGQSSPRFHATYSPQTPAPNYAQLIVNTHSSKATAQVLNEYTSKYENYFPNAYARFKQLDYQAVKNPLEVRVQGERWEELVPFADSILNFMTQQPELQWVHSDYDNVEASTRIVLKPDEATQLGITQTMLSLYLREATQGATVTTLYEGSYGVPVVLYTKGAGKMSIDELRDMQVPTALPGVWVPLRQVATIEPHWHHSSLERRNSVRTITVGADLRGATSQVSAEKKVKEWINTHITELPAGVSIKYGGLTEINGLIVPQILWSVVAALAVMLVLLLYHFGKIGLALLTLASSILCLFGSMSGLAIFGLDISITAVLGVVSLIGIIVRNAIMMYEYAEDARKYKHLTYREAAYQAGLRRMRPVFLTSATTALGVLPMIIAHTSLWMPMGVVICFGTIFTLPLTLTILPVLYARIIH
jgi:multidrug efflux pump subunit AcrB